MHISVLRRLYYNCRAFRVSLAVPAPHLKFSGSFDKKVSLLCTAAKD